MKKQIVSLILVLSLVSVAFSYTGHTMMDYMNKLSYLNSTLKPSVQTNADTCNNAYSYASLWLQNRSLEVRQNDPDWNNLTPTQKDDWTDMAIEILYAKDGMAEDKDYGNAYMGYGNTDMTSASDKAMMGLWDLAYHLLADTAAPMGAEGEYNTAITHFNNTDGEVTLILSNTSACDAIWAP